MQLYLILLSLLGLAAATDYFTISIYAPEYPHLHGKAINARNRAFIIGAPHPSTHCGLDDHKQCPAGHATLVNADMSYLASAVPGGQFIFVAPDGSISYPSAHSAMRPPGSQIGGFYSYQVLSDHNHPTKILTWRSKDGPAGLFACAVSPSVPQPSPEALRAATASFVGEGCLLVAGLRIEPAGSAFGAWEYI